MNQTIVPSSTAAVHTLCNVHTLILAVATVANVPVSYTDGHVLLHALITNHIDTQYTHTHTHRNMYIPPHNCTLHMIPPCGAHRTTHVTTTVSTSVYYAMSALCVLQNTLALRKPCNQLLKPNYWQLHRHLKHLAS